MKNLFVLLTFLTFLVSCSNDDSEIIPAKETKEITFNCCGDFTLESITRSSNSKISDIWIFDYVGNKLKRAIHQQLKDVNFGNPIINLELEYDEHTLYFVISDGYMPTVDKENHIIMWEIPGDTFQGSLKLEIDKNSQKSFDVEMKRVAAKFVIKVDNDFPSDASTLKIDIPRWFYSVDYTTGRAIHDKPFQYVSDVEQQLEYYTMTEGDKCSTSAYLSVLNNNKKVLASSKIVVLELEKGKCSTYHGSFNYNTASNINFDFKISDWKIGTQGIFL